MAFDLSFFVILFGGVLVLLVVLGTWVLWKPLLALVPAPPDAVRRDLAYRLRGIGYPVEVVKDVLRVRVDSLAQVKLHVRRGAPECGRDRPLRRPHRLDRRIPRLRAGRPVSAAQSPAVLSGPRFFRLRPDGRFGLVARVPAAFPEDSGARRGCELLSDGMDAPDAPGFGHGGTSGRPRDAPPGGHTLIRVARGPGLPAVLA